MALKSFNQGTLNTVSNAQGLVHINTTTFTGVTSQSINDVFSATYDNYFITLDCTNASSTNTRFRLRVSGADDSTSNYAWQNLRASGVSTAAGSATETSFPAAAGNGAVRKTTFGYIYAPFLSKNTYFDFRTGTTTLTENTTGYHNVASSFTGLSVISLSGNLNDAIIRIYGVKN